MLARSPALASIRSTPSFQDAELLEKAWALPVAKLYAPLVSQSITSLCGPTSVANVLRSMGIDSEKNPLRGIGFRPMSLDQIRDESAAVIPPGWKTTSVRPQSVEALRAELIAANEPSCRYVANFDRSSLFSRGGGHHSPLGGYLEREDLAFILDVNSGFGPWLVSTERLFHAITTVANWSNRAMRGLVRYRFHPEA